MLFIGQQGSRRGTSPYEAFSGGARLEHKTLILEHLFLVSCHPVRNHYNLAVPTYRLGFPLSLLCNVEQDDKAYQEKLKREQAELKAMAAKGEFSAIHVSGSRSWRFMMVIAVGGGCRWMSVGRSWRRKYAMVAAGLIVVDERRENAEIR